MAVTWKEIDREYYEKKMSGEKKTSRKREKLVRKTK